MPRDRAGEPDVSSDTIMVLQQRLEFVMRLHGLQRNYSGAFSNAGWMWWGSGEVGNSPSDTPKLRNITCNPEARQWLPHSPDILGKSKILLLFGYPYLNSPYEVQPCWVLTEALQDSTLSQYGFQGS